MATKMKLKKVSGKQAAAPKKAGPGTVVTEFALLDSGTGTQTVVGLDAAGAQIDISGVATLAAVSSDLTVMTVAVTGMSITETPTSPPNVGASATIALTATWNDGSIGPFTGSLTGTIAAGPVVNIAVVS